MLEIRKIEIIKDKFNIFGQKISRPLAFKEIYGINQLGAIDRDGSYSSWDFTGTINEVNEYEKRWCSRSRSFKRFPRAIKLLWLDVKEK